jgi:integrase
MQAEMKGVHRVKKKLSNGAVTYYYYAWRGGPRMTADIKDSRAFMTEWLRLTRERGTPEDVKTVSDLVKLYVAAADFTGLRDRTKKDYRAALDRIEAKFFNMPLTALEEKGSRSAIRQWRDKTMGDRPRTADLTMAVFNKLLNFAKDEEWISRNPLEALAKLSEGTRREMIWTDDQIKAFTASAPEHLTRALTLAKWTGQRQGDLLKLTWAAYDGTYIHLQQGKAGRGKTGKRVKILASAELKTMLDRVRQEQRDLAKHPDPKKRRPEPVTILTTERGAPWQTGFKASWSKAVADAEVTGVTFHDLRGTFITLAHRAGATIKEIAEASGHDEKECERVIRQHYLASGSEAVIRKLEAGAKKNDGRTKL